MSVVSIGNVRTSLMCSKGAIVKQKQGRNITQSAIRDRNYRVD